MDWRYEAAAGTACRGLERSRARVVPVGVPKSLLGTGVAGETRAIVNASDVILLYPIVGIEGDNSILRAMIDRAAHVAVGARIAPATSCR